MNTRELRSFMQKTGFISHDKDFCTTFDLQKDIIPQRWQRLSNALKLSQDQEIDPLTTLRNLNLVQEDRITYAGAWLLTDSVIRHTLHANILGFVFQGNSKKTILHRVAIAGNMCEFVRESMDFLRRYLMSELVITDKPHQKQLEIQEDALKEAITNAIVHRDYYHKGSHQHLCFLQSCGDCLPRGATRGDE